MINTCYLQPIQSTTKPSLQTMLILISLAWILPLILALVPLSHSFQDVFVEKAVVENNLFFSSTAVRFGSAKSYAEKLLTYAPQLANLTENEINPLLAATNWNGLGTFFATHAPQSNFLEVSKHFGFVRIAAIILLL